MPQEFLRGVYERLASIDTRLSQIEGTLVRQDRAIEHGRSQFQKLDIRDREATSRVAAAIEAMTKEISRLSDQIREQNSRVRKLELWKAEMSARTGVISAVVSGIITIILTVSGWLAKLKIGG